jgi:hypothetical protein
MDSASGFASALGQAFRELMQTVLGALQGFTDRVVSFTANIYSYIPRNYVIAGVTILVLGIVLLVAIGRSRR